MKTNQEFLSSQIWIEQHSNRTDRLHEWHNKHQFGSVSGISGKKVEQTKVGIVNYSLILTQYPSELRNAKYKYLKV